MNDEMEIMAQKLEASGHYRVLRQFVPVDSFTSKEAVPPGTLRKLAVVDCETTGLDVHVDHIIDLGIVVVEFDPATGLLYDVVARISQLEDPGSPLSAEITELTGITDAMVAGQKIDDALVNTVLEDVALVIAHNAGFDRAFLEKRLPVFATKWWACSMADGPWDAMKTGSKKLEWLVITLLKLFYGAHRALIDAEVVLPLLMHPAPDGRTALAHVVVTARKPSYTVWAVNSPFDQKDVLKGPLKYKWSDGSEPGKPKAWHKHGITDLDTELQVLRDTVYLGAGSVTLDTRDGFSRFTERYRCREAGVPLPAVNADDAPSQAAGSPLDDGTALEGSREYASAYENPPMRA